MSSDSADSQTATNATFVGTLSDWFNWTSQKSKNGIETVHEMIGLPWWTTITGITVGVRLVIFPLRLRAWKNGRLMKLTTEYCNKMEAPKLREYHQKNTKAEKRAEEYKKDMLRVHAETMKSIGVSPWKSLSAVPVSIPLYLSVAGGLRAIDYGGEGAGWGIWRDLGEVGWISAVPVALSNFAFIEYSRRINTSSDKSVSFMRKNLPMIIGHSINAFSFVVLTQVPSSVNLFLLTSSMFSIAESRLLRSKNGNGGGLWVDGVLDRWVERDFKRLIEKYANK